MSRPRVVLISLEGVPLDFSKGHLGTPGSLPFLESLMEKGAWGKLNAPFPPSTMTLWASLLTGRSPAGHGITDNLQVSPADPRQANLLTSQDLFSESLFSVISRNGRTVTAINFPLSAPSESLPGFTNVPGGLAKRHLSRQSSPQEIIQQLKGVPGLDVDRLAVNPSEEAVAFASLEAGDPVPWLKLNSSRDSQWVRAGAWLLKNAPTDIFALNLEGLGYSYRVYTDYLYGSMANALKADDGYDPQAHTTRRNALSVCKEDFETINAGLEEIAEAAGEESRFIITSPYELNSTNEVFYLNVLLEQMGYLKWIEGAPIRQEKTDGMQLPLRRASLPAIDFDETVAYCSGNAGGIRILNSGSAERKAELRQEIADRIYKEGREPGTKRPHFSQLINAGQIIEGPLSTLAPDLYVLPDERVSISTARAEGIAYQPAEEGSAVSGNGWMVSAPLTDGERGEMKATPPAHLLDVAPTLLYALGIPIPDDWEGKPLTSLFPADFRQAYPVQRGPKTVAKGSELNAGSEEETTDADEQIYQRLKSLGYVE